MTAYLLINHLINFVAPAAFMALMLGLLSRLFAGFFGVAEVRPPHWALQVALNFAIGVGVLLAGLVLLGRDGKMLTYLLLVLGTATSQWWQLGGSHDSRALLKKSATGQR
jgi:hypothetical protein